MQESLAKRLTQSDKLGPAFTAEVTAYFRQVADFHEPEACAGTDGGTESLPKRKLPSNPIRKLTSGQQRAALKVHSQAVDLILGISKLLERDALTKVSKPALDSLLAVGSLSLRTLYTLEDSLATPSLKLNQMASNFITRLIHIKRVSILIIGFRRKLSSRSFYPF